MLEAFATVQVRSTSADVKTLLLANATVKATCSTPWACVAVIVQQTQMATAFATMLKWVVAPTQQLATTVSTLRSTTIAVTSALAPVPTLTP